MTKPADATVYVVDDDVSVRKALRRLLISAGYAVEVFASAQEFLVGHVIEANGCLVLDIRMPGMDGLELQRRLVDRGESPPIVLMTGHSDEDAEETGLAQGAVAFLRKPFDDEALLAAVRESVG